MLPGAEAAAPVLRAGTPLEVASHFVEECRSRRQCVGGGASEDLLWSPGAHFKPGVGASFPGRPCRLPQVDGAEMVERHRPGVRFRTRRLAEDERTDRAAGRGPRGTRQPRRLCVALSYTPSERFLPRNCADVGPAFPGFAFLLPVIQGLLRLSSPIGTPLGEATPARRNLLRSHPRRSPVRTASILA